MTSYNYFCSSCLVWHSGIPENEVWIKIGGDKGGGSFKMNSQIVNVPSPNSPQNTCVFACFEAPGSLTNLHVALDRFKNDIEIMNGMRWRYAQYTYACISMYVRMCTMHTCS